MRRCDAPSGAEDVQFNITPMIDVTFQLLIFFMCTMKFKALERKVAAYLPTTKGIAPTFQVVPPEPKISVVLKRAEGEEQTRVKFLDQEIGSGEEAFGRLRELIARVHGSPDGAEIGGFLDAWSDVPHGDVVRCIDSFLAAGVADIEFKGAPHAR